LRELDQRQIGGRDLLAVLPDPVLRHGDVEVAAERGCQLRQDRGGEQVSDLGAQAEAAESLHEPYRQ
jgi:hypothetical protein